MSTSSIKEDNEEDDVEFVSEGPLRPVVEFIDLLSDGEDDTGVAMIEDQVDRQKALAVSTLDRLARQVAVEKRERAEKCQAFKEKMMSQQAHGRRELAGSRSSNEDSNDAKRCVDIWLKMPGLKPGVISNGMSWRRRSAPVPSSRSTPQTCPVINCGRLYDNVPLLEGHLKRFDHSPCDPTIMLIGSPNLLFACVACGRHFDTKESWRIHLASKVSSSNADGHASSQTYQLIVCFACPECFLLFNINDDCAQHMAAKKHFAQSISLGAEERLTPLPIPIPRYAKNRFIALCKDVFFSVKCTACSKMLTSHMEAKAHFNVHCRHGCAISESAKTVTQIMKQMMVVGKCTSCTEIFYQQSQIEDHREQTQHNVQMITNVEQALLVYSDYCEIQNSLKGNASHRCKDASVGKASIQKNRNERDDCFSSPAKRQRVLPSFTSEAKSVEPTHFSWFCECGLKFLDEDQVNKHILSANQIFYKCAVCGKLSGESSIARLHMSRFHGGAHLSNFLFHCRLCKVEMPRKEDILSHVAVSHHGHTFFEERKDRTMKSLASQTPSTSTERMPVKAVSSSRVVKKEERWMCRMCEDIFDSEKAVHKHCSDFNNHSFQRFTCGHCPQKFFKDSTLRRHCANEHNNQLCIRYFCGLCDSMLYDSEQEFIEHYAALHSIDYYCLDKIQNGSSLIPERSEDLPATSKSFPELCPCIGPRKAKEETKSTFTRCMKQLASDGKCTYICQICALTMGSYAQMKTHMHLEHATLGKDKSFHVNCVQCNENHKDIPSFHSHHHAHHCLLEPCVSSRTRTVDASLEDESPTVSTVEIVNADEVSPESNAEEFWHVNNIIDSSIGVSKEELKNLQDSDEELKLALALSADEAKKPTEFEQEMEEALKRSLSDF